MLVFPDANLTLLATPKTGSTSLQSFLAPHAGIVMRNPSGIKHISLQRYQRFVEPLLAISGLQDVETMALIRNPVDWLGSWYRYRSRDGLKGAANSTVGIDFNDFVEEYLTADSKPFARLGSQAAFVTDKNGIASVTHLFRYENMGEATTFLAKRLGIRVKLKHKNRSQKANLDLAPELLQQLEGRFEKDFILWRQAC